MILDADKPRLFVIVYIKEVVKSSLSSMDSGLEAFSHYPTHGSFAALSFQITAKTKYANIRFLSY